jgi:hypothetical protein
MTKMTLKLKIKPRPQCSSLVGLGYSLKNQCELEINNVTIEEEPGVLKKSYLLTIRNIDSEKEGEIKRSIEKYCGSIQNYF